MWTRAAPFHTLPVRAGVAGGDRVAFSRDPGPGTRRGGATQ